MNDPLRIAMTSYYLPSESKIGVGYQAHALANELVARGHEVEMFSPSGPVEGRRYVHHHLKQTGPLRTFRWATALRRVDLDGFDVLHAHGDDYWIWRRRTPAHIRTLHGSCFEEALRIRGTKERLRMVLLGFTEVLASVVADRTVAVSPATTRWTPWVRLVIPNGVDRARFTANAALRAEAPTILFVGTWFGRKRGAELARIFDEHIRPALPDARLVMVARDAPKDLPEGVVVTGNLTDSEIAKAYASSWVFCLPSDYEGFGIPYAESMSAGLPIVATPNVGARFVTRDGQDGMLTALDDLHTPLLRMLTEPELRQDFAQRSTLRAGAFDLQAVATSYEDLYRDEMARR